MPFLGVGGGLGVRFGGVLVPLKTFSLKRLTSGVFAVRFRGLGRKSETCRRKCVVLELGERAGTNFRPRQRKRFIILLYILGVAMSTPDVSLGNDSFRFLVDCRTIASTERKKWPPRKLLSLSQCILLFTL